MTAGPADRPVRELISRYVDERVARGEIVTSTAQNLRQWLRSFSDACGNRPVRMLGKRDVERWLEANPQWAPACRRTRLGGIRMFGDWLVDRRYLNRNPATGIKPPKMPRTVPRALTPEQVSAILAAAPDERARLVILLGAQQGLRRAEIAGLEVGHMDWSNGTMIVTGKGGHQRVLPITDETREAIRSYLAVHPATRGPLIRSKVDQHVGISPRMVGNIMTTAAYAAGVKQLGRDGVSTHALRHTAATDMLRNGAHVRDVQQVLGHAHIKTTEIYMPTLVGDLASGDERPPLRRHRGGRAVTWSADQDDRIAEVQALAYGTNDPAAAVAYLKACLEPREDDDLDDPTHLAVGEVVWAKAAAQDTFEKRWGEADGYQWARAVVVLSRALR